MWDDVARERREQGAQRLQPERDKAYSHGYMIDAEELYSVPNPENLV